MMRTVQRRMRRLAVVEFANIALLGGLAWAAVGVPPTAVNVAGFGLAALLLAEGGSYWLAKSGQLVRSRRLPRGMAAFRVLRTVNIVALTAGGALILTAVVRAPGVGTYPGLIFWLLAALEYINYFHLQLMYDTSADLRRLRHSRRLRSSHLAIDLRAQATGRAR